LSLEAEENKVFQAGKYMAKTPDGLADKLKTSP